MRACGKVRFRPCVDGLEARQLLAVAVVEVLNQSSYNITYDFRWTTSSSWTQITERPGAGELFWTNYSTSLTPQVLYDTTTSSNSQTTDTLTNGYGEYTGTGTPPTSSASLYEFQNTSTGVQLNYVPPVPTDAVVEIVNSSSSTLTFQFRWTSSSSWTTYTEAPGQSELLYTTYSSTLTPQVMYYPTSSSSSETTASLANGYGEWTGTGTPPTSAAQVYSFQSTSTGVGFEYGDSGSSSTLPPNPNAIESGNWSGYAVQSSLTNPQTNSVTDVSASWVVPTVTGSSRTTTYSSVWVGIDGYSSNTVEQIGTEQDIINGSPVYQAWWEMYSTGLGQPEQPISSMTIKPGDSINASVQYITSGAHAGQFLLTITDTSRSNDSFSTYEASSQVQSPQAQRNSAEWIVEAPTVGNSIASVANFGTVTFTNASATINGVTGGINSASWQSQAINIGSKGVNQDTTSVTNSTGTTFTVTYGSSTTPSATPGVTLASTLQTGGADRPTVLLSTQTGALGQSVPPLTLSRGLIPSGYRTLFRPAQAIEHPATLV
jgi:hypothetical protein